MAEKKDKHMKLHPNSETQWGEYHALRYQGGLHPLSLIHCVKSECKYIQRNLIQDS